MGSGPGAHSRGDGQADPPRHPRDGHGPHDAARPAMRAAVYAWKSQEQHCSDEAKSVTRQVEGAKAFAEKNGWTVAEAHVYIDDGVSGAEWVDRALNRCIEAAQARPRPFDVLVTLDIDRVG